MSKGVIHKHHLSPETKPGNEGNLGVIKLLPLLFVNCKNSSSTIAQTMCVPKSSEPVEHVPITYMCMLVLN